MRRFAALTGQRWKFNVWLVLGLAFVAATVAFFSIWRGNPAGLPVAITSVTYLLLGIVCLAWWAAAIRCPKCGKRPVWFQMTNGNALDFPHRLTLTGACPACGFDPGKDGSVGSVMT